MRASATLQDSGAARRRGLTKRPKSLGLWEIVGRAREQRQIEPPRAPRTPGRGSRTNSLLSFLALLASLAVQFFRWHNRDSDCSNSGIATPCSVMMAVINAAGVTSKAGL